MDRAADQLLHGDHCDAAHVPASDLNLMPNILPVFQEHLKASKVPWTALLTSCFMENFVTRRMYQRRADGARTWSDNLGSKPILAHAVADIGGSAAGAQRRC